MRIAILGLLFLASAAHANPDPKPEPCFGIESCLARCTAGHGVACTRATDFVDKLPTDKRAPTVKSLDATLTKQCTAAKDGSACYAGNTLTCDAHAGNAPCATGAGFRKGCDLGDGAACLALGRLASVGTGGEKQDAARAKALWDKGRALLDNACNDGSASACAHLGAAYNIDRYGGEDRALSRDAYRRAIPLFARDCRAGDAAACYAIHLSFMSDRDVKADPARSRAGLERACKLEPKHEDCKDLAKPSGGGNTMDALKSPKVPTVSIGEPATGNADKPIIKRYIKRDLNKVRYCYEKTLVTSPGLAGTVTVKFTIEPDGTVSSSTGSGLHPDVDSCVAAVVKGMKFPKPSGGGRVNVSYPFAFRPAT